MWNVGTVRHAHKRCLAIYRNDSGDHVDAIVLHEHSIKTLEGRWNDFKPHEITHKNLIQQARAFLAYQNRVENSARIVLSSIVKGV